MFEVIGDKEKLRPIIEQFVIDINNEMLNKEEMKKKIREKVSKVPSVNPYNFSERVVGILPTIGVSFEETDSGFMVKVPMLTSMKENKMLSMLFRSVFKSAKKNLEGYLEAKGITDYKIR